MRFKLKGKWATAAMGAVGLLGFGTNAKAAYCRCQCVAGEYISYHEMGNPQEPADCNFFVGGVCPVPANGSTSYGSWYSCSYESESAMRTSPIDSFLLGQ